MQAFGTGMTIGLDICLLDMMLHVFNYNDNTIEHITLYHLVFLLGLCE